MYWIYRSPTVAALLAACVLHCAGCGTTRSTDTTRTATEQLLISDAIDRAVQTMNLQTLAGQTVFLDDSKLGDAVDRNYFISTLRQHLLASGCELRDQRDQAEFVVEARAGAIGTDRNDQLFGLPSMNVPQIPLVQPVPAVIPEIPIAKRKDQRGIAKIAVFAYHRETGAPVWQSGIVRQESSANDVWIMGAGPFQRGTIYGGNLRASKIQSNEPRKGTVAAHGTTVDVSQESLFTAPDRLAAKAPKPSDPGVLQAAHQAVVPTATPAPPATLPAPAQTAAQPAASPAAPTQASGTPAIAAAPSPAPAGLSASVDPSNQTTTKSAYLPPGDAAPLPQPRFNSPK